MGDFRRSCDARSATFPIRRGERTSFDALAKDYAETALAEYGEKERATRLRGYCTFGARVYSHLWPGVDPYPPPGDDCCQGSHLD